MDKLIHEDKTFKNLVQPEKETRDTIFENCTFEHCDFSNGIFTLSKFIDCNFSNCNLTMAKLNNCQMSNVKFKECKLLGVNFSDCADLLFAVRFEGCVLDYCSFVRKKMPKTFFIDSSIKNVDFSECDLTKALFKNTDLLNTVFNRTILKEADFLTAINYTIDPTINTIKKAKFSLQGAIGLLYKFDIVIE